MSRSQSATHPKGWKYVLMEKGAGKPLGPVSSSALVQLIEDGTVFDETRVWHSKHTKAKWVKASSVPRLAKYLESPPVSEKTITAPSHANSVEMGTCPSCKHQFERSKLGRKWDHEYLDRLEKKKRRRVLCCRGCQKWIRFSWKKNRIELVDPPKRPSTGQVLGVISAFVWMPLVLSLMIGVVIGGIAAGVIYMHSMQTTQTSFSHMSGGVKYYTKKKVTPDAEQAKESSKSAFWVVGGIAAAFGAFGGGLMAQDKYTKFIEPIGGLYGCRRLMASRT